MITKEAEYNSLRAEILEEQSSQANLLIAMYTISIAIITFAIDKENTFLLMGSIFVNILFKLQILWKQTGITRLSAYIIVNYEDGNSELNWETDIMETEKHHGKELRRWFQIISISSSMMATFMSVVSLVLLLFLIYKLHLTAALAIFQILLGLAGILWSFYLDLFMKPKKMKELMIREFRLLNQAKSREVEKTDGINGDLM